MTGSRLIALTTQSMFLEIPLRDFGYLRDSLRVLVTRSATRTVLSNVRGRGALTFESDGEHATLTHIDITDDPDGQFTREVVIPLFERYQGSLEASVEWSPQCDMPRLVIANGAACVHPLVQHTDLVPAEGALNPAMSLAMVEQWLDDARQAWAEYQRLKNAREPNARSS